MKNSRKIMYFENMRKAFSTSFALKAFSGLVLGFGLLACSGDKVAGGGGSGTEAGNAITASIALQNGMPAKSAKITLIESSSLNGETDAYTAETDSNGIFVIDNIVKGNYTLEASLENSALQTHFALETSNIINLGPQILQKSVYMNKTLEDLGCTDCKNANGIIKFRGLSHSATVIDGSFTIENLPAGKLDFVFISEAKATDTLSFSIEALAGDSLVTLVPEPPKDTVKKDTVPKNPVKETKLEQLTIDDFTDGDNIHKMGVNFANPLNSSGSWFLIPGDNKMGNGAINIEPKVTNYNNPFKDVIEEAEDGGNQIHFQITFPDSLYRAYPPTYTDTAAFWMQNPSFKFMDSTSWVSQWYASFGLEIGESGKSYDLSAVDSISFEAWGNGSIKMELIDETKYTSSSSSTQYYNANFMKDPKSFIIGEKKIELSKEKTRIAIALSDILPDESLRKKISMISWVFHDDAELFFDNLEFIGTDLKKIWEAE